jgi:FixJ family two-component response regulator
MILFLHDDDSTVHQLETRTVNKAATVGLVGIVDDDESVRNSISSLLRSAGYKTLTFESAEAFLGSGLISDADSLVLDVKMPGLSGIELQRRLIDLNHMVPIIFITAHADDEIREVALAQGALAFFAKPFNDEALLSALGSAVDFKKQ